MKRWLIQIIFIFSACSPGLLIAQQFVSKLSLKSPSDIRVFNISSQWFEGGDLYKKTAREWHASTEQNKLATSAGMLLAMTSKKDHDKLIAYDALVLKAQSITLSVCISEATNDPRLFYLKVAEIAAACFILLGSNDLDAWVK